jgi:hypothetical protein
MGRISHASPNDSCPSLPFHAQNIRARNELPRATRVSFAGVRFSLDYNQSRPAPSEMSVDRNVNARRRQ